MSDQRIAAAYIRVSTEDQVEYSPDAQLVEIRKYADRNNLFVPDGFIFMDEGISGKNTARRDAFNQMIGVAKQKPKPFDAILLWKFSRFARNREDSVVYKSMLRKQLGIEVISISEPVGDDKMSILIEALIEAMDEYYSINLAEEVKRGMTEKAKRGELQSIPSFGYSTKDNILIAKPQEAALVHEIFSRFIAGEGIYPIAKWLNDMGATTHRGKCFENRTVEYILCNPVYIGKLRWNPSGKTKRDFNNENIILADGKHESLISEEIWTAAQHRMAVVKAQRHYKERPKSEHRDWLSGRLRCSACGKTLLFTKPHYWKCGAYCKGACKVSQHIHDEKIKSMLMTLMRHDRLEDVTLSYRMTEASAKRVDEKTFLLEQMESADKKLARLREAYLAGVESLASYSTAKHSLEERKAAWQETYLALASIAESVAQSEPAKASPRNCIELLFQSTCSAEEKQRGLHEILDHSVFCKEENSLHLVYRISL